MPPKTTAPGDAASRDTQQLAFAYQSALQRLKKEEERTLVLLEEIDRLNHELELSRDSKRNEADSRLRAEEALDDTRERLQIAVEATNLVLWDFKAPFHDFYLTSRWGEILGEVALEGSWGVDQLKQRVHPDDLSAIEAGLGMLLSNGQDRGVVEFRFRAVDRWVWIESHGMIAERDGNGRPVCLIGTLADITQRKANEQRLAQALELADQASQAKSDFLSNISHEIRTPLNALMGLNALLLDTELSSDQRHWLELMNRCSQSLLKLLNDLLDISRIEAGKLMLETVPFDLRPFLDNTYDLYVQQGKAQGVTCTKRLSAQLPARMVGDPGRIGQVLSNLLSNAVKFTAAGGSIVFEATVQARDQQLWLEFKVQDSGIGMSKETLGTLFRSFTQADASISNRFGGSGMGLAICSRLVDLMGGTIRVESQFGHGSTFYVQIPLRVPQPLHASPKEPVLAHASARNTLPTPLDGLRVLLAEDHAINEMVMRQMLSRLGCHIEVAHNGQEAVKIWQRGQIDLILMDVQMPECNGLMATQQIRMAEQKAQVKRVPIVALTANAMSGDRDRCLAAGMDAYLSKPLKGDALVETVRAVLTEKQAEPAWVGAGSRNQEDNRQTTDDSVHGPATAQETAAESVLAAMLPGDMVELTPTIVRDLDLHVEALAAALQSKDARAANEHAHKLQATLGFIQGERGSRLCRGLEMAANAGEWNLFARAFPLLRQETDHLKLGLSQKRP
jgi:signal transduction histidine kinase/DNA-binding response OmpR family regulator